MIAAALGAPVYPGGRMELGFAPVMLNGAGAGSPLRHLDGIPVLHWHSDTFDLPSGVELLASTESYAHQAFRRGSNLLALQFHAEMRSEEHTSELQSLMRISYAVFCLKKKQNT